MRVVVLIVLLALLSQAQALRLNSRAKLTQTPSPSSESASPPSSLSDESSSDSGPNANSVNSLQGMGIAVVLKNRNHIRTVEDKAADHVEREESRKQLNEEQKRKEHYRNLQAAQDRSRQQLNEKEETARRDQTEAARKNDEEQSIKKAAREESEKTDRRDEQQQKQKAAFAKQVEQNTKKQEQNSKESTQKTKKAQEEADKKREDEKNGVIFKTATKPAQGKIIKSDRDMQFTGEYTYMMWLRPLQKKGPWSNVFHKGGRNENRNPAMWFYPGRTALHIRSGTNSDWNNGCDIGSDLPIGEWTHIAILHDSKGVRVFRNAAVACESNIGAPLKNDGPLYFSDPWHEAAGVDVADFRMVSRVVDVSDIDKAVKAKVGTED